MPEQDINALNGVHNTYKRYNTRHHTRKKEDDEVLEIDGIILACMERSVGSIIKTEAIKLVKAAKVYANLDKDQKKIVILGLNSICDSSNNSDARRLLVPCFQATGLDGELKTVILVAPGLHIVQYIGSIPIPSHAEELKLLRTKRIPILNFLKVNCLVIKLFSLLPY